MFDKDRLIYRLLCSAFWLMATWGFLCDDLFTALAPTHSYVMLLCDGIMLMLGLWTIRTRHDMLVLGSFAALVLVSGYLNGQDVVTMLNGSRHFISLIFAPCILGYLLKTPGADGFVRGIDRQLLVFLCLQAVCIPVQFVRYGAGDMVGGSLGHYASGTVSTMIYLASFYLLNKRWDAAEGYMHNMWVNRRLVLLLLPTFLNETKISFIFLLMYFVLSLEIDRRFIGRFMLAAPLLLLLMAGATSLYFSSTGSDDMDADFFIDYLVGLDIDEYIDLAIMVQDEDVETDNIWVMDLPRMGRFLAVPDALADCGGKALLGPGVGQFKGNDVMQPTPFAAKYSWLLGGSPIFVFFVLMQLGIAGLVWAMWVLYSMLLTRDTHPRHRNLKWYIVTVASLICIYSTSLEFIPLVILLAYLSFAGKQPLIAGQDD